MGILSVPQNLCLEEGVAGFNKELFLVTVYPLRSDELWLDDDSQEVLLSSTIQFLFQAAVT